MITLTDVTISRNGSKLIEHATLQLARGEKAAICGRSGCGKSSLLTAIAGCFIPDNGRICVNGIDLNPAGIMQIRHEIAFITQEPVMGADTVREALLLPFTFHANRSRQPEQAAITARLEQLQLDENIIDKPCSVISGGEKQRIAIARALLLDKSIFLLDEVTSALDPVSREPVLKIFSDPAISVLSVSHDPQWLEMQHRVYCIADGRLTADPITSDGGGI